MRRFLSLTLSLILLAGCSSSQPADRQVDLSQPPAQSLEVPPPPPEPEPEPEPIVAHLMVGGDVMSHTPDRKSVV